MFSILQEEEGEMEMEGNEEVDKDSTKGIKVKELIQENTKKVGSEENADIDQTQMEIDLQKENGNDEEQVMKKLLQDWRNLDERVIPEEQKQLYKEMFQKYKEKKEAHMVSPIE